MTPICKCYLNAQKVCFGGKSYRNHLRRINLNFVFFKNVKNNSHLSSSSGSLNEHVLHFKFSSYPDSTLYNTEVVVVNTAPTKSHLQLLHL